MFRSSPIPKRAFRAFRRLLRDRRGAAAVILAITLPWIIGFAGLGSEVAAWYFTTRAMQGAVDAAAESAAAELAAATVSGSLTSITDQLSHTGRAIAATFNFSNGVSSTTVSVNRLSNTGTGLDSSKCDSRLTLSGPYGCYVEVVIQQPQPGLLSAVLPITWPNGASGPTITTRAVGWANTKAASTGCVVALDRHASRAMNAGGTGTLTFNSCALYANSDASDGIYVGGSGVVNAQAAYVVGNINGTVNTASGYGTYTGVNPIVDPYANVPSPSGYSTSGTCGYGNGPSQSLNKLFGTNNFTGPTTIIENTATNVTIINPIGCSKFGLGGSHDLHLTNTETLVLCPGTYVFDAANLIMDGQSTLIAPPTATTNPTISAACVGNLTGGVTIIFSNSSGGSPGIPSISAGANVTLTAPTSGTYSGVALFGDRLTCSGNGNNDLNGSGQACAPSLVGGGNENITGAIYFPLETVTYGGGASAGGPQCTQIVANRISFSGGSTFNSNCESTGGQTLNLTNGTLAM
jgi:Flp pilus assembly protein TadG